MEKKIREKKKKKKGSDVCCVSKETPTCLNCAARFFVTLTRGPGHDPSRAPVRIPTYLRKHVLTYYITRITCALYAYIYRIDTIIILRRKGITVYGRGEGAAVCRGIIFENARSKTISGVFDVRRRAHGRSDFLSSVRNSNDF